MHGKGIFAVLQKFPHAEKLLGEHVFGVAHKGAVQKDVRHRVDPAEPQYDLAAVRGQGAVKGLFVDPAAAFVFDIFVIIVSVKGIGRHAGVHKVKLYFAGHRRGDHEFRRRGGGQHAEGRVFAAPFLMAVKLPCAVKIQLHPRAPRCVLFWAPSRSLCGLPPIWNRTARCRRRSICWRFWSRIYPSGCSAPSCSG